MKNPETILKTMETNQKVLIFRYKQTDRQTLHHNIYITTTIITIIIIYHHNYHLIASLILIIRHSCARRTRRCQNLDGVFGQRNIPTSKFIKVLHNTKLEETLWQM